MTIPKWIAFAAKVLVVALAVYAAQRRAPLRPLAAFVSAFVTLDLSNVALAELAPSFWRLRQGTWLGQGCLLGFSSARFWGSPLPIKSAYALSAAVVFAAWLGTPLMPRESVGKALGLLYLSPVAYGFVWTVRGLYRRGLDLTPERAAAGILVALDVSVLAVVWAAGAERYYVVATLATAIVYVFLGWRICRWIRSVNG